MNRSEQHTPWELAKTYAAEPVSRGGGQSFKAAHIKTELMDLVGQEEGRRLIRLALSEKESNQ